MSYGLAPRPELPAEELAAVIAAATELLRAPSADYEDGPPSWRFSGRWFNAGRFALRRPH